MADYKKYDADGNYSTFHDNGDGSFSKQVYSANNGGPVTAAAGSFVDGAITTLGAKSDTQYTDATGSAAGSLLAIGKGLFNVISAIYTLINTYLASISSNTTTISSFITYRPWVINTNSSTSRTGQTTLSAATAATIYTRANPAQYGKTVFVNSGANAAWIGFTSGVTASTGFYLAPNGGTFIDDFTTKSTYYGYSTLGTTICWLDSYKDLSS
jgi:hypothetical protein